MSDIAKDYVLADATPSAELKRLREIDDYMRPTIEARIARLGIAPGWKCLFRESLRDTPFASQGRLDRFIDLVAMRRW